MLAFSSTPSNALRAVSLSILVVSAGPALSMNLQQAYQAALQQDATIRAARAAADVGDERVEQAKAMRYPNMAFSAARNRNDLSSTQRNVLGRSVTVDENYTSHNATLTLRQPVYRKSLSVGLEQAYQMRAEVGAQLDRELQSLGVRVTDAYLQLLLAQDQLALARAQKNTTTTQLDAARKLLVAGSGTRTDIDEAQARLDMAVAQELEIRQQLDYARRQLETLVNQPVEALSPLDEAKFAAWAPEQRSVQDWLALAEDNSPEIRQQRARLDVARLEIEKARAGHLPTLDAVAQWTRSGSENVTTPSSSYTNRVIGLQLNMPLFAGGYVNSTVRQAVAEQVQARELLEAARRDLSLRIHTEFRGVSEGRLRILALEQAARSATQLVVSSRRSFEGGARTLVDILNAEQQKELALRDLARARYTYLVSYVRLQALAGGDRDGSITAVNALLKAP